MLPDSGARPPGESNVIPIAEFIYLIVIYPGFSLEETSHQASGSDAGKPGYSIMDKLRTREVKFCAVSAGETIRNNPSGPLIDVGRKGDGGSHPKPVRIYWMRENPSLR